MRCGEQLPLRLHELARAARAVSVGELEADRAALPASAGRRVTSESGFGVIKGDLISS